MHALHLKHYDMKYLAPPVSQNNRWCSCCATI